jgi:hypothetical protein
MKIWGVLQLIYETSILRGKNILSGKLEKIDDLQVRILIIN